MTTAVCLSGFLLLVFITGAHADYYGVFGAEGGSVVIEPFTHILWKHCSMLYRVILKRDLLLLDCCQRDRPPPEGYNVECTGIFRHDFEMKNLTTSQTGDYRAVHGRGNAIVEEIRFRLTVCAEHEKPSLEMVKYDEDAVLCRKDPTLQGTSLQLYRRKMGVLLLDTKFSLEPLEEDVRGRLQVDLNTSQVTLSEVTQLDSGGSGAFYYCVTWRGAQCQSYSQTYLVTIHKKVFAHEGESVTLPCIRKGESPSAMYWYTPNKVVRLSSNNQRDQYMLNGSQTGDYSLIIPSVSLQHFGGYGCFGRHMIKYSNLYICTKVSSLDVMFSHGESVILEHSVDLIDSEAFNGVQWYRQKVLQPQVLILEFRRHYNKSVLMPEDLRDRVTVSSFHSNYSLTISNLTEEDSGVYMWRVYGPHPEGPYLLYEVCYEGTTTLKIYPKKVFAHAEESVTLPCIGKGESPSEMRWSTPNGKVKLSSNQSDQYMLNGSQTGDYSLIIPSVSLQHSGGYECKRHHLIKAFHLYVCTKVSQMDVVFSHGESVILEHSADLNGSWALEGVQWYCQKVLQPQVLILEFNLKYNKPVLMPEDLRDRVTVSSLHPNYSLTISNLIAENSGVYMWRVYGQDTEENDVGVCYEGSIHLRTRSTDKAVVKQ